MVRNYELAYIVRADLAEDAIQASVNSVTTLIEEQGGEVVRTALWGKRHLAYPIEKMREGYYAISAVRLEPGKVTEVDRGLKLNSNIFRHMIILHDASEAALGAVASSPPPDDLDSSDGDREGRRFNRDADQEDQADADSDPLDFDDQATQFEEE